MKYLYPILIMALFPCCNQPEKETSVNSETDALYSSQELAEEGIPYAKLTKGKSSQEIKSLIGDPEKVGTTNFGDLQWTYSDPKSSNSNEKYRKVWIVFDKDHQVKETHTMKVCWLSE